MMTAEHAAACHPTSMLNSFAPSLPSKLIDDPEIIGFHILPKGRGNEQPVPGSLYAWAANRLSASSSSLAQLD
jgi:hypothetical protein